MIDATLDKINKYVPEKWRWVLSHGGFRRYFKNTGWMFVGQMTMIISLAVNIWLARYLGPEKFGTLNYVFAFVGLFSFIANLGVSDILIRELVRNPENEKKLLGTAFRILGPCGIIAFLFSSISALIFEPSVFVKVLIFIYSATFLFSPINIIPAHFQAKVQAKKTAQAQIISVVLTSLFKVILILSGQGILWLIFAFILEFILGAVIYSYNYLKSGLNFSVLDFDYEIAKKFLTSSIFLALAGAMIGLLLKIDQVMIKYFLGESSVGLYAAAVKLSEIWYFIPGILCGSLFPAIINSKGKGEDIYKSRLKKLYILLIALAFLLAVVIVILSPFLIRLLYGNEYLASINILKIYIWSGIGLFLSVGMNKYLMVEDKIQSIFYYNISAVIINIILNIILIPAIGLNGAAFATLISYSVLPMIIMVFDSPKIKKI